MAIFTVFVIVVNVVIVKFVIVELMLFLSVFQVVFILLSYNSFILLVHI